MNHPFQEEIVNINGAFTLEGTLTIPAAARKKYPAVLIISGTGKSNRDGNGSKLDMNLYKDLAEMITKLGFITLRYDKRGTHKSKGVYIETGFWDLVDDAESAVRFLASRPEVDNEKIIILGHSEGCMIAAAVNARAPQAGLVLLAGVAEPSKIAFPRQVQQALKEIDEMPGYKGKLIRFITKLQNPEKKNREFFAKVLASTRPSIRIYGLIPFNAKWYREQYAYNVMDELSKVTCPTLAITGSNDIQVIPDHARLAAETVKGESEWHVIPHMNHILRKYEKPHTMLNLLKEYKKLINKPIDPDLYPLLSKWLQKHYIVAEA
ncbi:alpha/beta hydrolase [Paenibacillus abyssi]|uniref:Alpha/beta hydrolase n=1 Tax=Paenibacillus abyssi TaxID=1340531 RepID=A0A917LI88_9BACL|nr:alpha/beta hydrolase [Paenibacillus abyssi]GGG26018.1 alpha/beta hydrolase [Paenibacillus abyssi]